MADNNRYYKVVEAETRKWLLMIKQEWLNNPQGCENYVRLIEKKYGGDYEYYCKVARRLLKSCIRRGNTWYFLQDTDNQSN